MATAAQLMGLGVPGTAASLLDSGTPQATSAQLIAAGLPPAVASSLGDNFVASPPTVSSLMALGVPAALAALIVTTPTAPTTAPPPTLTPIWAAARARVAAGTGRGRIVCVGSSETAGDHAAATSFGGANHEVNAISFSYPAVLAQSLTAAGVPASFNSFMGDGNFAMSYTPATYLTYNPNLQPGGFVYNVTQSYAYGAGGHTFFGNGGITGPLVWAPPQACDTIEISYVYNTGLEGFNYAFDGGAASGTISCSGLPAGTLKTVATASALGMHSLAISEVGPAGNGIYIAGCVAYNSAVKAIDVINVGWCGGTAANFAQLINAWNSLGALPQLKADLYILELAVNDSVTGVALPTFQANAQTVITALKAVGDVVLVISPPYNNGGVFFGSPLPSAATRATYDAVVRTLGTNNNLLLIDLPAHFTSWAAMGAVNKTFDNVHPNQFGYADMGNFIGSQIVGL